MSEFYVPKYKWQLVAWMSQNFPGQSFSKWSKKRLYAAYFRLRASDYRDYTVVSGYVRTINQSPHTV